jgi:hypothetical protein
MLISRAGGQQSEVGIPPRAIPACKLFAASEAILASPAWRREIGVAMFVRRTAMRAVFQCLPPNHVGQGSRINNCRVPRSAGSRGNPGPRPCPSSAREPDLVDVNGLAFGALPTPAAVRNIVRHRAIAGARIDVPLSIRVQP